jgi:lantibiotic modifying enzyme
MPESPLASWRPLLSGSSADRALQIVEEIARDLYPFSNFEHRVRPEAGISLAEGRAGASIFFAYLDRAFPGQGHRDKAIELLDEAVSGLDNLTSSSELYNGFVGIAWVLEHLQGWIVEDDDEDPGAEIAEALQRLVHQSPWIQNIDLTSGLVGLGVHALERRMRPGVKECLRQIVHQLAETSQRQSGTAAWWTPPSKSGRGQLPEGHFNLGMAHGASGVVAFLAEACAAGLEVRPLLDEAVAWILAQKLPPGSPSVFPLYVVPDGLSPRARLGWCYGDAGTAIALIKAARSAGEPAWESEALMVAHAAARRRSDKETQVVDATICHGTSGLLQIFNRLYQASGDSILADAALFWAERTLSLRKSGVGGKGFLAWDIDDRLELGWRAEPGFLMGAAGIGLALLAAATSVEPAWDRLLLTSLPPQQISS